MIGRARRWSAALAAGALASGALAAHAGPFDLPGTQPHALDSATPPEDTVSKCSSCHAGGVDDDGHHYRPWDTWSGTMMANAARDPLFLAALTVAEQDAPGVGTYCIRCHSPQAFARGDATPGFGTALTDDDKQGVACEACHRSVDPSQPLNGGPPPDSKGPYAGDARLFWDPGPVKHGPYADADSPAHTTTADPFTSSSKLCGQCHEVDNPAVHQLDDQGQDTGRPFPLDTTYTEWASSSYASGPGAKGCIDCHMPKATGDLTLSTFPTAMTRHDPSKHAFVGGNVWGIDAVQASDPALAQDRKLAFTETRAAAMANLGAAVKVAILSAPDTLTPGTPFAVSARVDNLAGHRFPTGYADGRRAWLRVELVDGDGKTVAAVGRYDDTAHTLVGDPELHVYEAVHGERQASGPPTPWHIARSNTVVKDTRLPPAGFVPGPTTQIIGADYGDGMGGTRSYDEVTVHLTAPDGTPPGNLVVRGSVMYQSTVAEFVEELAKANTTDARGSTLKQIWAATGYAAPIAVATDEKKVVIPGAGGSGGSGGSAGAGGSGGSGEHGGSCGCTVPGAGPGGGLAVALAALGLAALRRGRRARREV